MNRRTSVLAGLLALAWTGGIALAVPAEEEANTASVTQTEGMESEWTTVGVRKFRKAQRRPIQLGTSGGNAEDFESDGEFITCFGGTLGGLLQMGSARETQNFVLSNNHVLARANKARRGDDVIQPALLDSRCVSGPADVIGELSDFKRILFNNRGNKVDMSIAAVEPGAVQPNGRILKLGIPGNSPVEARLGMAVQKVGRTTGHTRGTVVALDFDLDVSFSSDSIAVAAARAARFVGQIIVEGRNNKPFVEGGDSGSMVYENAKPCPRAVGLVFAGSGNLAAANPIGEVLAAAKNLRPKGEKTLVGCSAAAAPALGIDQAFPAAAGPAVSAQLGREASELRRASLIKRRWREVLFEEAGVVGVGVAMEGPADRRRGVIQVFVERADPEVLARIPTELDGRAVRVRETGRFRAF
jgi:hypothetical protein